MKSKLSLLIIAKKNDKLLEKCLDSSRDIVDEIIIVDDDLEDLGEKRKMGLAKVSNEWVLVLDTDEVISRDLKKEIASVISKQNSSRSSVISYQSKTEKLTTKNRQLITGYLVPFQNHFLGRQINYGGENYKMLRLFRKDSVIIDSALVHEGFRIKKGEVGELKNKIYHYSYRSLGQMFSKFTNYAIREAKQKAAKGEKTGLKKILMYPPHMFWARFVKDKGYKDGMLRIPLDLGFAYMELLTYLLLLFMKPNSKVKTQMSKPYLKA